MKRLLFITVICAFIAVPALGDTYGTVELVETNVTPQTTMTIYAPGFPGGIGAYTGVYHWNLQNASITTPNPFGMQGIGDINTWGFCIEMQYSPSSYVEYNIVDLQDAPVTASPSGNVMGDTKADYIRELWAANIGSVNTNIGAAAFQASVWEIVYEDAQSWDVDAWDNTDLTNNSSFMVAGNATVISTAQGWLDALTGSGPRTNNLVALSNNSYQDYVVQVPVPGAVLLGMLGLSVAGIKLRKFA